MRQMSSVIESLGAKPRFEGGMWLMRPCFRRTHPIRTTLFGDPEKTIAWPWSERIGLIFEVGCDPLIVAMNLLRKEGFKSPEELREVFEIPRCPLACRTNRDVSDGQFCRLNGAEPAAALRQALMLGLCGESFYDPNKAVIWTTNRLTRKLDLFQPGRFYADY